MRRGPDFRPPEFQCAVCMWAMSFRHLNDAVVLTSDSAMHKRPRGFEYFGWYDVASSYEKIDQPMLIFSLVRHCISGIFIYWYLSRHRIWHRYHQHYSLNGRVLSVPSQYVFMHMNDTRLIS